MRTLKTILILTVITCFSCAKPQPVKDTTSNRTIRYEVSGNFTGTMFASYTTANGGTINEQLSSSSWNKDVVYQENVAAAIIAVSGNGGSPGQQIVIVVKSGNRQLSSTSVTVDGSGSFTKAAPVVTF